MERDSRPVESVPDFNDGTNVLIRFFRLEAQTEKAYAIILRNSGHPVMWLPKSKVAHIDKDKCEMWIPMWLAKHRGLAYE